MPFCPICRSEFRSDFTYCANCDSALVPTLADAPPPMDDDAMAAYLSDKELVIIAQASIDRIKTLKNLLCANAVANIMLRPDETCGSGCATGGCSPTVELAIAASDMEKAAAAMKADFQDLVGGISEGEGGQLDHALELDGDEIICPACDMKIAAGSDECPSCGLFVGVPPELLAAEK